jgi:hypothetical protein
MERAEFSRIRELPDCQLCEPMEPWQLPHKAMFTIRWDLRGTEIRVCGTCLEGGVGREFVMEAPTTFK